ncbi:MAG: hypothetical protein GKS00_21860 [Alphaproteobacteria bacterium]|nr:hypothetical protein [Alphaproteobacteria bacterium]
MFSKKSKAITCDLRVMLFGYPGITTCYDGRQGLRQKLTLIGQVDCPNCVGLGRDPLASHFHGKPVRLEIVLSNGVGQRRNVCGTAEIKASVEPRRFDIAGELVEEEPIRVKLSVNVETLESIRSQVVDAYFGYRLLAANLALLGAPTSATSTSQALHKLYVPQDRTYMVQSFEIFNASHNDALRGRVLPIWRRTRDQGAGTSVSILFSEIRYNADLVSGYIGEISCSGHIVCDWESDPCHGSCVDIEFCEFERSNLTDEPSKALTSGAFVYFPGKSHDRMHYLSLQLNYALDDIRDLLMPLLTQEAGTQLLIKTHLDIEREDLLKADDTRRGGVRYYLFDVTKMLPAGRK